MSYNFNQQIEDKRRQLRPDSWINNTEEASEEENDDSFLPEYISSYRSSANAFSITRLMNWVKVLGGLLLLYIAYSYLSVHGWPLQLRRNENAVERMWRRMSGMWRWMSGMRRWMSGMWRWMSGHRLSFRERAIQAMSW